MPWMRKRMVEEQIAARGIRDPRVLTVMGSVLRHCFIPPDDLAWAYADGPLPIGYGQTISQPYIVALMTELLELGPTDRVLEVGGGCGYQAAVLGELAAEVHTVEVIPELARQAEKTWLVWVILMSMFMPAMAARAGRKPHHTTGSWWRPRPRRFRSRCLTNWLKMGDWSSR